MCITTVVRANKSECIYKGSDFSSWFFNVIDDCIDSNDLLLPTYTFTELDTLNHLHKVEVNSSSIPNMAEVTIIINFENQFITKNGNYYRNCRSM